MQEQHQRSFYRNDSPKHVSPTEQLLAQHSDAFDQMSGARSFAQNYHAYPNTVHKRDKSQ